MILGVLLLLLTFFLTPQSVDAAWFKGNTHTHTNISDGNRPPQEMVDTYKNLGYDFLIFTDHNFLGPTKGYMPDFEYETLSSSNFVVVNGTEMSETYHINGFGVTTNALKGAKTQQDQIDIVVANGAIPAVNHPRISWMTGLQLVKLQNVKHLEIFNQAEAREKIFMEGSPESMIAFNEAIWDNYLTTTGKIMYGLAVDDAHSPGMAGNGWIMVQADSLNRQQILNSIKDGNYYFTTGALIDQNIVNKTNKTITVSVKDGTQIDFIGKNGRILLSSKSSTAFYTANGSEMYIRSKVKDASGKVAWTQPIFVSEFGFPVNITTPTPVSYFNNDFCTPDHSGTLHAYSNNFPANLSLHTSQKMAGAISSILIGGTEVVSSYDHGYNIQYAMTGDNLMECFNPTEAGNWRDSKTSTSLFIEGCSNQGKKLYTKNRMAFYVDNPNVDGYCPDRSDPSKFSQTPVSDYFLSKIVELNPYGLNNVIKIRAKITVSENRGTLTIEAPTSYITPDFTYFSWYDVAAKTVKTTPDHLQTNVGGYSWFGRDADIPIISNTQYSIALYAPINMYNTIHKYSNPDPAKQTSKLTTWYQLKNITPGDYYLDSYLVISTVTGVKSDLEKLVAQVPPGTKVIDSLCQRCPAGDSRKSGDSNCDGIIDIDDRSIWRTEFTGDAGKSTVKNSWRSDYNCDGKVDIDDRSIWRKTFTSLN